MLAGYTGPTMAPSTTDAAAFAPEGALMEYLHPDYGVQIYRMLRNHTGSAFAVGIAVDFEADSQVDVEIAAANSLGFDVGGITQNTVPAGYYFWGLVRGKGQILSANAIAAGAKVKTTGGAGKFDDVALTLDSNEYLARALEAAGAGDELKLAEVFVLGG